jgi:hypothetical protein
VKELLTMHYYGTGFNTIWHRLLRRITFIVYPRLNCSVQMASFVTTDLHFKSVSHLVIKSYLQINHSKHISIRCLLSLRLLDSNKNVQVCGAVEASCIFHRLLHNKILFRSKQFSHIHAAKQGKITVLLKNISVVFLLLYLNFTE